MKKVLFLSLALIGVWSMAYAQETKAVQNKPTVHPKKTEAAKCVEPAKPAAPAKAAPGTCPPEAAK